MDERRIGMQAMQRKEGQSNSRRGTHASAEQTVDSYPKGSAPRAREEHGCRAVDAVLRLVDKNTGLLVLTLD